MQELEKASFAVSAYLYEQVKKEQAGATGHSGESTGEKKQDDSAVDADYEVIDEGEGDK